MLRCRSYLQMLIILGGLIGGSPYAISAPLCSSLFETAPVSKEAIEVTIADIARMKMEVDLDLISGDATGSLSRSIRLLYTEKLNQLESTLRGKMTRAEIYKMIAQKIVSLQNTEAAKAKVEQVERKRQTAKSVKKISLTPPSYKLVDGRYIPEEGVFPDDFQYIPATHSVLLVRYVNNVRRQLTLLDLRTLEEFTIAEDIRVYRLSPDRESVYVLTKNDYFKQIDLNGKSLVPEIKLVPAEGTIVGAFLDISPSGTYLATKYVDANANFVDVLQIFNIKTGELAATVSLDNKVNGDLIANKNLLFHFVSDERIVATKSRSDTTDIIMIDVFKGTLQLSTTVPNTDTAQLRLSDDRTQLFVTNKDDNQTSGTALTVKLSGETISNQPLPKKVQRPQPTIIPTHPNHVFITEQNGELNHASIIDILSGKVVFNFNGQYTGKRPTASTITDVDFTPDGYLMVYGLQRDKSGIMRHRVDIWQQTEEQ